MVKLIVLFLATAVSLSPALALASSDSAFLSALAKAASAAKLQADRSRNVIAASRQEEDALLALLSDQDVKVRTFAVKALKIYVDRRMSTRDRVLDLLHDRTQPVAVRAEALKTLSVAAQYGEVHGAMLALAAGHEEAALRAMAYKALCQSARQRGDIRGELVYAAQSESDKTVRLGAIWGLYLSGNSPDAARALIDIVRNESDEEVRIAALKSLYGSMVYPETRNLAMDLARRTTSSKIRYTAILSLSTRTTVEQRQLLESIALGAADPAARRAAAVALGDPRGAEIVAHFHLPRRDDQGRALSDPLDDE